jgi:small subunit ribosomal protein S4
MARTKTPLARKKTRNMGLEWPSMFPKTSDKKFGGPKLSEYGKQLQEKQKVKLMYGVLERQFHRFFSLASRQKGVTGENLLSLLERRLDNVVYRLKFAASRSQARQMVVHGHVLVNGKKVAVPSSFISKGDEISISARAKKKESFLDGVVHKRLNIGIKVPEWLELKKSEYAGVVLRNPERADIKTPIEEHLIVELYSK